MSEKKILGASADLIDHKTKKLIKNLWKKHLEK